MLRASEWFRPQPGEIVYDKETDAPLGVVTRTRGNLCFYREPGRTKEEDNCYIWRFTKWVPPYSRKTDKVFGMLNKLVYTWPDSVYRDPPQIEDCYA